MFGPDAITDKDEKPFHAWRGIKFNLPYQTYAEGDPFTRNEEVCLDVRFWKAFIDTLAANRYNCLGLWSENPFERMVRLDGSPTRPLSPRRKSSVSERCSGSFSHMPKASGSGPT